MFIQSVHAVCLDPKTSVSGYQMPINEEIKSTKFIAIGEVIESKYLQEDSTYPEGITATIQKVKILKQIKGNLPGVIELRVENDSGRYWMEAGERHLLFLSREGQHFIVDSCGNSSGLSKGNEVLKKVESMLASSCKASPLVKGACFMVTGTLSVFNGWPPFLRIETDNKEKMYGIGPVENELVPTEISSVLPNEIKGEFEVCPFAESTSVPYDPRPIEMVCVETVKNARYWDDKTGKDKEIK